MLAWINTFGHYIFELDFFPFLSPFFMQDFCSNKLSFFFIVGIFAGQNFLPFFGIIWFHPLRNL